LVEVEQWAEIRRMQFVCGFSIKEIVRRTGRGRNTVRRAVRSSGPPRYQRRPAASKLDPFKDEIHRLLKDDPKLPGQRMRELIEPLGYTGSKTILDDYLREVRPLFAPQPRTFQRTAYRPGEVCQFDLWEPSAAVPVGHLEQRRAWVVVACLGYSRAGAGALVFSKETPDLLWGIARCLWSLGGLPATLVWDRQAGIHGHGGRPVSEFAGFCGQLKVGWRFCEPADPRAKGVVERLQGYLETNFERGRSFANERDYQLQLDAWFEKANARTHKTLRCRPVDRLIAEREQMAALPAFPDLDRRWVMRVPADPYRLRHQRLLAQPDLRRAAGRGPRLSIRGRGGLPGHGRARRPPRPRVRAASDDHRDRACPRAARAPRRARRAGRRDASVGRL
jgi:transposase